jgi:glycosyltransferase involved in cell wall biosynthesis
MRIAQVAPLWESVPPKTYGGTERVVSFLTEELVRKGHQVTLYASGDSETAANLIPGVPKALRLNGPPRDHLASYVTMVEDVRRRASDFDLIHFHIDYLQFLASFANTPTVTTQHGRLDFPELPALYRRFREHPLVSISDAQRAPLPEANWVGTVHHGLPLDRFLGRISREKRPDPAIAIARRLGIPLKIANKLDPQDRDYYGSVVGEMKGDPLVEFVGEISDGAKNEFLGRAMALLFPIDWPEPFGLVMIEALACGTPVVAFRRGSVPEILEDGAARDVESIDRRACRRHFETHFALKRMADDYLNIYKALSGLSAWKRKARRKGRRRRHRRRKRPPIPARRAAPSTGSCGRG